MSSFASAKGPSIPVRFAPEYLTRQPFELGFNPEASSSTPAFCSSSWYFCISDISFSEGITPASESFVALTIIMNRMLFSNRRTRPREIDTPPGRRHPLPFLLRGEELLVGHHPGFGVLAGFDYDHESHGRVSFKVGSRASGRFGRMKNPALNCTTSEALRNRQLERTFVSRRSLGRRWSTPPPPGTLRGAPGSGACPRRPRSSRPRRRAPWRTGTPSACRGASCRPPPSRGSRVRRRARRCYFLRPCFVSSAIRSARRSRVSLQPWFWPRPGTPGGVVCRTVSFVLPPSSANVTVVRSSWPGRLSRIAVKTMRSFRTTSRYTPWKGLSSPSGPRITKRYAPPGRKSISQPGSVKPFGPHHLRMCSGSVHSFQMSSRGASKTRVRIISPACLPSTKFFSEVPTISVQPCAKFFLANAGSFGKVSRPACVSLTLVSAPWANSSKVTSESPAWPSYRHVYANRLCGIASVTLQRWEYLKPSCSTSN